MSLCALSDVKTYLSDITVTDDGLLNRLISAASDFVPRYLGRDFVEQQTFTRVLNGNGRDFLIVPDYPLASLTSVVIGNPFGNVTLNAANYAIDRERYVYLVAGFSGAQVYRNFPLGRRNVTLTGVAGYSPVPAGLQQAAIELVSYRYREMIRLGDRSKSLAGEVVGFVVTDMTEGTRMALEVYKNRVPL